MSLRPEDKALAAYLIEREVVPFERVIAALNDASSSDRDLGDSLVRLGLLDQQMVVGFRAEVAKESYADEPDDAGLLETLGDESPINRPSSDGRPNPAAFADLGDHDTWFDLPAQPIPPEQTLPAEHTLPVEPTIPSDPAEAAYEATRPEPASTPYVDDEETKPPTAPRYKTPHGPVPQEDWGALGPTVPSPPARVRDVVGSQTLDPTARIPQDLADLALRDASTPVEQLIDPWADPEATAMPSVHHDANRFGTNAVDVEVERSAVSLAPSGKRVEERYQLLGEMGRGGMGRILKSRDTDIGREVAVKILLGGGEAPENLIRRFWTEVQATGQLEHPSIIPIHDVGRLPSGELFYVMKKLEGDTLLDILNSIKTGDKARKEEFQRVKLLTIYQQIVYAVAFAHAHGVIHRDIKPANIMVGAYGEAILIDWGLAKIMGSIDPLEADQRRVELVGQFSASETASGTITGTPQYMSPEATEGRPHLLTPKSDVYGLGAVLYEILTLEPAYPDVGFVPTVMKVREGDFVKPRLRAPHLNISIELEELVLLAMSPDPEARPEAKTLADEMGRILEGAKERSRREHEARTRVRAGRRSTDRWKQLKVELQSAEAESKRLAKEVPPWADVERKMPIWRLEDRVSELKIEAVSAFEEAEADFLRALGEVPDDREARSALSSLYFARFGEAERARDVEGMRYYRSLVSRYDDGVWERVLEGDGTLTIEGPPTVSVSVARMETVGRVLRPGPMRRMGPLPVRRFEIPIGSYLVVLHQEGHRDLLRPVLIGRTESVTVHARPRTTSEIGDTFVLVPEGRAILGGDSVAHGALERRVVEVAEFAIARFPVTCDEYLAFLDALAKTDLDAARRHVPRARAQEGHYWRFDDSLGRFVYPERTPGGHEWIGSLPVNGVSFEDALAFVKWRASVTGERLRLPHETEWEKAARGVDGRFFPWGDHFDPTFCKMKESRNAPYPEPEPVGTFPTDCSPYGARDMAGGIRELCVTESAGRTVPVMRGGCWSDTGLFCRVAFRHVTQPDFVNTGLGFRLAKDLDP